MQTGGRWLVCLSFNRNKAGRFRERRSEVLLMILVIVLLLALFGSLPSWPHSRNWGYYPSGGISLILLILLILFLMGRL
jgi:hypothetical protein